MTPDPGMTEHRFTAGRTSPCAGCPWRVGNAARSCGVPGQHETHGRAFTGEQGFFTVMACHTLPPGTEAACVGYLLSEHAFDNFAVRLAASREPETFEALRSDGPMHRRYEQMAAALVEHWGFV